MSQNLTCIICPRGCSLTVTKDEGSLTVAGNSCPKGKQYAIEECTNPTRTVTSVVRVKNRPHTMVSVKTEKPIPKGEIFNAMQQIRQLQVSAPVQIGAVLIKELCGTRLLATKNVE